MIATRYEELDAWQLADELKRAVYDLVRTGPAARDDEYCEQIRNSAASTTKNIAEGFGRFRPKDFAHFMEFAIASAMETQDSLKDGIDRGYFVPDRVAGAQRLAERTIKCSKALIAHLKGQGNKPLPQKHVGRTRRQPS